MLIDHGRFERALERRTTERTPGGSEGPLRVIALSAEAVTFFREHRLPATLSAFFEKHSYDEPITIGKLIFDSVNTMPEENVDEVNARCIQERLLIVGSGLNGDPIVIDLENDLHVGFIKHDDLWDEDGPPARTLLADSGLDIGTFFLAASLNEDAFPVDAYDAEELDSKAWAQFAV